MSQASDLLNSLTSGDVSAYTAYPEDEEHIVVDGDRFVTVPDSLKRIAVQHDHNMETVTFDCPRYWDGIDMSVMKVFINYMLPNGELGVYMADNVAIDADDDTMLHFSWTISSAVTKKQGNITFSICIKEVDTEGNVTRHWNSELNREMYVSQGQESIVSSNTDMIVQLLDTIDRANDISETLEDHYENGDFELGLPIVDADDEGRTLVVENGEWVKGAYAIRTGTKDDVGKTLVARYDGLLEYNYIDSALLETNITSEFSYVPGTLCSDGTTVLDTPLAVTGYSYSDLVDVGKFTYVKFPIAYNPDSTTYYAFYDSNYQLVYCWPFNHYGHEQGTYMFISDVPDTAKYLRTMIFADTDTYPIASRSFGYTRLADKLDGLTGQLDTVKTKVDTHIDESTEQLTNIGNTVQSHSNQLADYNSAHPVSDSYINSAKKLSGTGWYYVTGLWDVNSHWHATGEFFWNYGSTLDLPFGPGFILSIDTSGNMTVTQYDPSTVSTTDITSHYTLYSMTFRGSVG